MIKDVIDEILLAENKAEKIIGEAREKEKEITFSLTTEMEKIKEEYATRLKDETKIIIDAAVVEAESKAKEIEKENAALAIGVIKAAERNVQKTVEYLADAIAKQYK